ncbi:MAG: substrate-binding domain-containing protein [Hyphomicrobiales bacterium]
MRKPRRGATPAGPKVTKRQVRQRIGVNINDIAERAGVAPATVSRALNGYEDIAAATRERILALASELNYQPSSRARQLARGSVETVSFVLPVSDGTMDPFIGDFLDSLAAALAGQDYDLLVATVRSGETEIEVYKRLIAARKCAGFIVTNSRDDDPRIKLLQDLNVPFVVYGRAKMETSYAHLDMDNEAAIAGMVDHLVALGHRRFAYLDLENNATFSRLRRAGFERGVTTNDIAEDNIARLICAHTFEGGQSAIATLFDAADAHLPTAVVCPADVMAIGAIQAVSERGYTVGRDVSVTGYDGAPLGAFTSPPLTTMSQPIGEIGERLVEMLFDVMQGADPAGFGEVLMPTLIRRASDGSPTMVEGASVR